MHTNSEFKRGNIARDYWALFYCFFFAEVQADIECFSWLMVMFWSEVCCVSELERFIVSAVCLLGQTL